MSEAAVASASIQVGKLLYVGGQSLGAVTGQVEHLQREMERMQCFLEDADKKQDEDKRVLLWVSEIRELAYDVEDVIATFIAKVESRREKGFWKKCKRYVSIFVEAAHLYKLSNEIDAIRDKLNDLTKSLKRYDVKFNDRGEASTSHRLQQQNYRRTYSYVTEDHTVGSINDHTNVLLEQLVGGDHNHRKVISICGMGGIGKTTLAKKIFHHDDVRRHYNAFAWICVSQTCKTREVLEETLIKLTSPSIEQKEKISKMSNDEVAKELYQVQQNKKCLVILDDIWSKEAWDAIRHAFPIEKIVGTILLTTRNKHLGLYIDLDCYVHVSQTLLENESWQLFQTKAFRRRDYEDITSMENLGREMVKKCSGLPLAIIALAGVLATKYSLNEWNRVHKSVGMYLKKGEDREYSSVEAILALSYSELPYNLKPCLLHLSQFPEDFSIPTKMLFRLWMAEGIVATPPLNGEETLEDIAEGYLKELVDRSVVQIGKRGSSGKIKSCHLHDLIRELSLSKAKQENYLEIVDVATRHSIARRVVVRTTTNNVIDFEDKSRVRSLIGPRGLKSLIIGDFHMLRVLSLKDSVTSKKRINGIGKLIHLKYISLDNCGIEYLPSSLGNLRYLQTFFFKTSREQDKLKIAKGIWNFQELRHLEIYYYNNYSFIPLNLGNLRNLRTLRTTIPIFAQGLEKLTNLQKLTIQLKSRDLIKLVQSEHLNGLTTLQIDFRISWFAMLHESELRKLILDCGQLKKLTLVGQIEKLPEYHQHFAPRLAKLNLEWSRLNEDPMPVLEKLPKLNFLQLLGAFVGEKMVCSSNGFPRLKTLFFGCLPGLVEWEVDEGAMASLRHLRIEKCGKLKMVPEGIKYINTLSRLDIFGMPDNFTNRVKVIDGEEGEDYYKVRHVPSIPIGW